VQDVIVVPGSAAANVANSAIYHTVQITNVGSGLVNLGWRNLYDWQVDDPDTDDGPNNSVENAPGGTVIAPTTTEFSYAPAAGDFVRVGIDPGAATYEPLLALGFDPLFRPDLPVTLPDEYAYTEWPSSSITAFDYTIFPLEATDDSAGLSWFGRDAARALALSPGGSVRLTQILFAGSPGDAPPDGNVAVPEPSSLALSGLGACIAGLRFARRRRATPSAGV
jgi:hypothetical protein